MIAIVNVTIGLFLKRSCPLTLLTLGIFWWVINALMITLASRFVRHIEGDGLPAGVSVGAIVLAVVQMILKSIVRRVEE